MALQALNFPAREEYQLHWISAGLMSLKGLAFYLLPKMLGLDKALGYDILNHAEMHGDLRDLKEGVRGIWQQSSTVAALVFPMAMAMIQESGRLRPVYYDQSSPDTEDDSEPVVIHLQQMYLSACVSSLFFSCWACVSCMMNFAYVESLAGSHSLAFFLTYPETIGGPLIFLWNSIWFFLIALCIWMLGIYGLAITLPALIALPVYAIGTVVAFRTFSRFDPSAHVREEPGFMMCSGFVIQKGQVRDIHKRLYARMLQQRSEEAEQQSHPEPTDPPSVLKDPGEYSEKASTGSEPKERPNARRVVPMET
ncbi:AASDH [Symbiodinium necroappetens]|uniref:AASDH protein n=1 Tax=Symbiodinium necroappetens TaxID=1628268 RepID=A0A813CT67_9DINO|nr:AASDH [Symbiodinium necroappetens]